MLFRNKEGILIEICKKDYIDDVEYYKAIMNTKNVKQNNKVKQEDEFKRIADLIKIK